MEYEPLGIIKDNRVANNYLPLLAAFSIAGHVGLTEDLSPKLLALITTLAMCHGLQFLEAYFRERMDVRRYVSAVLTGSERVRGENSLY